MKNRDGLENSDNWATPKWLYDELDKELHFDFDPCPLNADFNGLEIDWGESNFVNPPYNRIDKPKFINRCFTMYHFKKKSALLIPSATGTIQFHNLIAKYCKIRITWSEYLKDREKYLSQNLLIFMEGRIAFEGINTKGEYSTKNKGKHDSMIVILRDFSNKKSANRLTESK